MTERKTDMKNEAKEAGTLQATSEEAAGGFAQQTDAAPDASAEAVVALDQVLQERDEWKAKADEYLDRYRRSVAELANYRKRIERDREQDALRFRTDVMASILPILDDFQLAIENIPDEYDGQGWVEGITLIERKLMRLLESYEVAPIQAVGEPFDPRHHEAFAREQSDEYPEGTVTQELRKGYLLGDRVLRPTLVKVSDGRSG
ncbi:MAG: nucleotide exchange factor GrpE [Chloroflexi bacterium]|nr:nucleotide exchange factor GrpE [Chloroflexota bacterium]